VSGMIAFCGLDCSSCEAFIATKNNDNELRKKTAKKWEKEFNHPGLKAGDINCNGCLSNTGKIFKHCNVCEIRKCCQEKNVDNCGFCDDYSCQKLTDFFEHAPSAKENLEEIRSKI